MMKSLCGWLFLLSALPVVRGAECCGKADESMTAFQKASGTPAFHAAHPLKAPSLSQAALQGRMVVPGDYGSVTEMYLSIPQQAPLGGVVVIHEWWGLNEHIKSTTDSLAAEGYVALAVDLYEGKIATNPADAQKLMGELNPPGVIKQLNAAVRYLREETAIKVPKVAVLGWCLGGGWSLQAALQVPGIDACVMYYGPVETDTNKLAALPCPLLGIFAKKDAWIKPTMVATFRKALTELGRPAEIHEYDAEHAFANPSNAKYNAKLAADARAKTMDFLSRTLGGAPSTVQ